MIHLSTIKTDFNCPICTCTHTADDWQEKYINQKKIVMHQNCKGCKRKLGITTDIKGDVVVWEKGTEL